MQNTKFDILHELENTKKAREKFDEYAKDTYKYVDKYIDIFPEGHKGGWNDSVDAFRHAFMQAHLKYKYNDFVSKQIANLHERNGNKYFGQAKEEEYMDEWNNSQGREIADEVKKELKNLGKKLSDDEIKDYIAFKIIQRMKSKKLITSLNEAKIKMKNTNLSKTHLNHQSSKPNVSSPPVLKPNKPKAPSQNFSDMIRQKYKNQQNKSNEKFRQNFPRHSSSNNTENGHWVTMNGAHVFIEDK